VVDTRYSTEQEAFRDSLRRYLTDKCDQSFIRQHWDEVVPHSDDLWSSLVGMGVSGLLVPEAQSGLGMTMIDMGVVMEELGRRVNPAPVLSSCVAATTAAVAFAQDDLLQSLASGEQLATVAFEERQQSLLNWPSPTVQAENGKLNGEKVRVMDAMAADVLFVTASDGVYLLDCDAEGVTVIESETFDGSRRIADIVFENAEGVKVGDLSDFAPVIDRMLVAISADAVGAAEMTLSMCLEYAKERVQFGVPVGSFQAVQHMCAEMFQQVETAKAGLRYALWAQTESDAAEAHRSAVLIKAFVSEYFPKLGADAIQIYGGAGFTWEYDIQMYYKRLLSAASLLSGSDIWFEELARIAIRTAE